MKTLVIDYSMSVSDRTHLAKDAYPTLRKYLDLASKEMRITRNAFIVERKHAFTVSLSRARVRELALLGRSHAKWDSPVECSISDNGDITTRWIVTPKQLGLPAIFEAISVPVMEHMVPFYMLVLAKAVDSTTGKYLQWHLRVNVLLDRDTNLYSICAIAGIVKQN